MIGVIVVTHLNLGLELIKAAEFILGRQESVESISVEPQKSSDTVRDQIESAISKVDLGEGAIILTDMFGGTPSNLSLSFHALNKVEILTGVNLPMLIKLFQTRKKMDLTTLSQEVSIAGRKSINVAGEILGRPADE